MLVTKNLSKAIKRGENQVVNMPMVLEGVNLLEVVVKAGENPAHRIIRNVIANKEFNNKRKASMLINMKPTIKWSLI
jgi:hypothetical protein